jgi:hypothetical protein
MRPMLFVVPFLLLPGAISQAQTSSPMEASPGAIASPRRRPSGGMMGQPLMSGPHPFPPWPGFHPRLPRAANCGLDSKIPPGDLGDFCHDYARHLSDSSQQAASLTVGG